MDNEIKAKLIAIAGVLLIFSAPLLVQAETVSQASELEQWPESVAANNYKFCRIGNFETCAEDDWFGVYDTELSGFALDERASTKFDPHAVMCKPIGSPPSSDKARFIANKKYGVLRLCRLKSKQELLRAFSEIGSENK